MARFYGDLQGQAGAATRRGSKTSGLSGHLRGWDVGARVVLDHVDGKDRVSVYRTAGSHGARPDELVARWEE